MSGIVGIVDLDGAPVDDAILGELTDHLAFRGPDRRALRRDGAIGFGHALLANTLASECEHQPLVLEDVWIVADARIDDQDRLRVDLRTNGPDVAKDACDAELILRAYHVWGIDCVAHLMGDFAFAIWDPRHRRLMLARDHFGVAPLYYAQIGNRIVFSNTLQALRRHPDISSDLNDAAIADFLLFGYSIDLENTFFAQIRSVPPAHRMVWEAGVAPRAQRFWSPPANDAYHQVTSPAEFAAELKALITVAVRDRLRGRRTAIALSGGLDSGAVAAIAGSLARRGASSTELHSYCFGYDWMVPETERYFASLTADAAGIRASYISIEQAVFDGRSRWRTVPEPRLTSVRRSAYDEMYRQIMEAGERNLLSGVGGDALLGASPLDWHKFLDSHSIAASARALTTYGLDHRWLPISRMLATMRAPAAPSPMSADFAWLTSDFVRRGGVRDRIQRWVALGSQRHHQPERLVHDPFWVAVVSQGDPEFTGIPAKSAHPFLDLRLLRFAMGIAPIPWQIDKMLLREAMRGVLPEPVRKRRKTSPTARTVRTMMSRANHRAYEDPANFDAISGYVEIGRLRENLLAMRERRSHLGDRRIDIAKEIDRPVSLAFWLKSVFS